MSRPRRKWDDIIEIDRQEVGCVRMDYICLCHDRVVGSLEAKRPLSRPRLKLDYII